MSTPGKAEVVLSASFDNIRSRQVRLLHEASKLGPVHVYLWDDATVTKHAGAAPTFPVEERRYYLESLRYVQDITVVRDLADTDALPAGAADAAKLWAVCAEDDTAGKRAFCRDRGLSYRVIGESELAAFPEEAEEVPVHSDRKKVLVTGCYDWFHTGHVRFFEEVSELGDLYVVVGHDENIRLLKGEGHPLFKENERRYLAGSIRFVKQAVISTGEGWLDAEPEILRIKPDIYAVNEDGDKPVKRQYCKENGIAYTVLKRLPKPGLPRRESTQLRGF
jgi:cytidyltransferase-like protein